MDDKDKTDEERMENVYRTELGTNFESMDDGVCEGKTTNILG